MGDPKRLSLSGSGLDRALLAAAERKFEPPPAAFDAVWAGVASQIVTGAAGAAASAAAHATAGGTSSAPGALTSGAAGSGTAGVGGASGAASAAAKLGGLALVKWTLVAIAASGLTALGVSMAQSAAEAPSAPIPSAVARIPEPPQAPEPTDTAVAVPAPPDAVPPGSTATVRVGATAAAPTSRVRPSTLPEETATITRAREHIQGGAPAEALRVLDAYDREHRGGLLGEERELLRVRALAALGDPRARSRAAAFMARHPQSSYVERFRPFVD